jgi:phospholipid/cholesterol/gamma-HCH transport system ATP-binding protein
MENCVIRVEHVWTSFKETLIHQDITFCLRKGEILGLVGSSGSGKTTLLREMIGLQAPTGGQIYVFDYPLSESTSPVQQHLRNRCGVLFQGGALFSTLNVYENIALPLRELHILDEGLIRHLVCAKLNMVGLNSEVARLTPAELSGGMVTRVALARALALEPPLLFFDEPTSGLDPIASEGFVNLVKSLHQELAFSMFMITHDLYTLADLCHRIAVLADQRLIALGPLEKIRACKHPFIQQFFHGERAHRILDR